MGSISPSMGLAFEGKVALVTGSSRGIGREIALGLALRGADIIVNYLSNEGKAQEVVKTVKQIGGKAVAIKADVSSYESIQTLFREAVAVFGKIDIVVSNSGVEHFETIEKITPEQYDHVFSINTRGQFFVAQQGYQHISPGGSIILTSSIAANLRGLADHAIYSASKAAIEAFVRSLPSDFAPKGVRVNAIAPGGIDSDMANDNAWRYVPGADASLPYAMAKEALGKMGPLGRFGVPGDVAKVVAFLASEEGGWINGQTITISGGAGR
ncbi:hypothetical protein N7491_004382 [Penicillium cf. griseofulvum]|uniref:Uncharacterized protein n=1 Tax=Penicillium cf. griseofulvum TaxID=2972120 RepID=A0A9W9J165_9EURO|nr:hypothetical protein N7472_007072 [Penicillium cf. griseofulvum]KAJ5422996.1 hypothetical protein N7445_011104 [Penicillium cf. griseofulvum]KAJ5433787.1 hypothetical protein N7491_004382 [Penicillium cf. griseofulvum]